MFPFRKKKDDDFEERELPPKKKFKDLKPEHKRKRKEPVKPWGRKERLLVLWLLSSTAIASALLAASARSWKLPGLPAINLSNFFGGTIVIEKEKTLARQDDRLGSIVSEIKELTSALSGVYGVYYLDLGGGGEFGVNEDKVFQAASLIKLPVMVALYQEKPRGYQDLVIAMGKRSDNAAFNKAVKILGEEKISEVIDKIGLRKTNLAENETTPSDIGLFFQKLYQEEILPQEEVDEILESLTDTIYEDWLPKGLPPGVAVAHKFGREVHVVNDAGIVLTDKPFILVVMTKGIMEKEADEAIPSIARLVYDLVE